MMRLKDPVPLRGSPSQPPSPLAGAVTCGLSWPQSQGQERARGCPSRVPSLSTANALDGSQRCL